MTMILAMEYEQAPRNDPTKKLRMRGTFLTNLSLEDALKRLDLYLKSYCIKYPSSTLSMAIQSVSDLEKPMEFIRFDHELGRKFSIEWIEGLTNYGEVTDA